MIGSIFKLSHRFSVLFPSIFLQRTILCGYLCFCLLLPPVLSAEEILYNGILLPDQWPVYPKELTRAPLTEPPYLLSPPKVIPIDVGRQLFVDDFLIAQTTLKRVHHHPEPNPANPIIKPDKSWEGKGERIRAGVFSDGVWYDPEDRLFKAWYWGGAVSEEPLRYSTCMATSKDGIVWKKPLFDVVPGTNIVLEDEPNLRRNSSTEWLDLFEQDRSQRFKMFRVVQEDFKENGQTKHHNFIRMSVSPDGIHWKFAGDSADCGDRSTIFYNAFRKRWVFSLREGGNIVSRCRGYYEGKTAAEALKFKRTPEIHWWIGADELDPAREDLKLRRPADRPWDLVPSQLYNLDCNVYESVLLGMFTIWRGQPVDEVNRPKINEVCVGYSRDGFNWSRPDRSAFIGVNEDSLAWNYGNVQSAGGSCLVVGDKLYFYVGGTQWLRDGSRHPDPNTVGLFTLRRDGFVSMDADKSGGILTTRPVQFTGRHMFVNIVDPKGRLTIEVLDESGKTIEAFTRAACVTVTGDYTRREIRWKGAKDISALAGKPVSFRFYLTGGSLYSFWVSKDTSGDSNGFYAAGGPG
jgi:hypothetical protein